MRFVSKDLLQGSFLQSSVINTNVQVDIYDPMGVEKGRQTGADTVVLAVFRAPVTHKHTRIPF